MSFDVSLFIGSVFVGVPCLVVYDGRVVGGVLSCIAKQGVSGQIV